MQLEINNKKRILIGTLLIMSIIVYIFFSSLPLKLPLRVLETNSITERYLHEKYPKEKFNIEKSYCMIDHGAYRGFSTSYRSDVTATTVSGEIISFPVYIKDFEKGIVQENYINLKMEAQIQEQILSKIENKIPSLDQCVVSIASPINQDSNSKNQYPFWLELKWQDEEVSVSEFIDKVLLVRDNIDKLNMKIYCLEVFDKTNGFMLTLAKEDYNLSKEKIIQKNKIKHLKVKSN